ncbi:hypothetical protein AB0L40_27640 [Patulibacter sp. NPDC049589]|uniref:hypothetical protein n=1 Tax=Patulibacter sp. NPDC049589 TaxID=3154731 RepID=UPI00342E06CD
MRSAALRRSHTGPVGVLLASVAAVLLFAGSASATPYTVWSCQGPDGAALPGSAWSPGTTGTGGAASADCAGGMQAGVAGGRSNVRGSGTLTFTAPAGTRISEYELQRTLRASVGGFFSAGYVAGVSSVDPAGVLGPACSGGNLTFQTVCAVGAPPLSGKGVSLGGLVVSAGCGEDTCANATPAAEATLTRSRVVLDDPRMPTVTSTGGTLKDEDRVARSLTVATADAGGGVASIVANVDGGRAARSDSGGACTVPYTQPQPCPLTRSTTFSVDTGALRKGDHVLTGTVVDAAGNAVPLGPVPFTVSADGSNDPGPAPQGSVPVPVSSATTAPGATARLTFQGTSTKEGRRRPTGYLRTLGGTPLAGVAVRLTRTQTGAATPKTIALPTVRTGRNGRFVAPVLPEGAWTVAGAADISSGTVSGSIRLRTGLRVTAIPSTTRLRTGALLVLSGRLGGAGPAKAGVRIRIQTIVSGRYRTVAAVRTTATGRWQWRHRFTKVSRPTLFAFRALVPGEGDTWPWKPVSRRATVVRVDPR